MHRQNTTKKHYFLLLVSFLPLDSKHGCFHGNFHVHNKKLTDPNTNWNPEEIYLICTDTFIWTSSCQLHIWNKSPFGVIDTSLLHFAHSQNLVETYNCSISEHQCHCDGNQTITFTNLLVIINYIWLCTTSWTIMLVGQQQ